ncbi:MULTISPECIES: TonB-dependent receptor [Methylotenera]|uniref:TonB-dependent receptor n=1 Tax=Methylotenera TaxID=359407 RepID=UPI00035C1750|nr:MULTISPECIES: TonB-dependent siderophore receptor [Methylotenera]
MQHATTPKKLARNSQLPKLSVLAIALSSTLTSTLFFSATAFAETSTVNLPQVDVNAERISDTQPVKGYNAKKSSSSTRTETELRDTPQAITVIPQDLIKDQSIQSISEAIRYVPGVQAAQGEGNRDALIFRGNATTGDFFIDGLRDDVQTYRDIYNTDRIEVLKGPNGMAFGRGGAGGALNRVSKQAGWTPISELIASYGAYDQKRIAADYGQALNDEIAFRVNAVYENSDSYRDGVNLERFGITPTVTIRPDENTKIVVGMEYFKDKRVADRGVPSVNGAGNSTLKNRPFNIGDEDTFFGNARLSPTETETVAFNASIEHSFDSGITVKNSSRYANYDKYYQNVFANSAVRNDGTLLLSAYRDETKRENFINQTDLTYTAKLGSVEHKLLAGAEFSVQDTTSKRLTATGGNLAVPVASLNPTQSGIVFNTLGNNRKSDVTVAAFYLQDQIIFSPQWQAIVGLRNDNFDTDFTDLVNNSNINVSNNLLAPRAGLIFKPVEAVSIYTNYSVSYVPRAGDQLTSLTVVNSTFKPEKFINYEVGAKWDVNSNLALTAAVYKLKRENIIITDPNDTTQSILVDGQETKGIELGLSGNITNKWSVFSGVAFQDGEITKQQGTGNSAILKGTELAQTPDRTLSLWNKYEINDMWAVALGIVSTSDRYAALPTAAASTVLPGYTRYDAAIYGKFSEKLRLQVNLENLTNKEYALYAHTNNNITPGSPITGRATLIYSF